MAQIDYFFATLSPYCYLAGTRLEEVASRHGATITYKPFDIVSAFSRTGGTAPKDRHPSRQEYRAHRSPRDYKGAHGCAQGRTGIGMHVYFGRFPVLTCINAHAHAGGLLAPKGDQFRQK